MGTKKTKHLYNIRKRKIKTLGDKIQNIKTNIETIKTDTKNKNNYATEIHAETNQKYNIAPRITTWHLYGKGRIYCKKPYENYRINR